MAEDWFDAGGAGKPCDVLAIMDSAAEGVATLVAHGALVSIGQTSDGGALGITVTVDGRWRREYFRDGSEAVDWLAEASPAVRAACEASRASSGSRKRSRSARGL